MNITNEEFVWTKCTYDAHDVYQTKTSYIIIYYIVERNQQ